ncbi:hypothetical protein CEXT_205441 [Caerostris extrusa]|uniref:Transposase Tc1-like domain-containing protein n=1 Tax=Caerostris extrusa TaxID=172846 RepID=A0AAV4V0P0_CAEEX|nr:hypothetical protein CEXT_205441 [Caerostris extrusa]
MSEIIQVSWRTVQQRLREFGLRARKPYLKPKLTQVMIKKRLECARKYKNFSVKDWKRVTMNYDNYYSLLVSWKFMYVTHKGYFSFSTGLLLKGIRFPNHD